MISVSRKLGEIQISSATSVAAKKNKTLDIVIPLLVAVACIVLLVIICITVYIYKKKEGKVSGMKCTGFIPIGFNC